MSRVKIFVDFWNFQLAWNQNMKPGHGSARGHVRIGWRDLPTIMIGELPSVVGASKGLEYRGTNVYASVNPRSGSKDEGLRSFLHNVLGQMTGYRVTVKERRPKTDECRSCGNKVNRTIEKGIDASIVTDLFDGSINDAYDIAVLISNDSDFVPAIRTIQDRLNKQIIHVGFRYGGNDIRTAAWGHIVLDGDVANKLKDD